MHHIGKIVAEQTFTDELVKEKLVEKDYILLKETILRVKQEIKQLIANNIYDAALLSREHLYEYIHQQLGLNDLEIGNIYLADGNKTQAFAYHKKLISKLSRNKKRLEDYFDSLQHICFAYQQEQCPQEYAYFAKKLITCIEDTLGSKRTFTGPIDVLQGYTYYELALLEKEHSPQQLLYLEKALICFHTTENNEEDMEICIEVFNRLIIYYQAKHLPQKELHIFELGKKRIDKLDAPAQIEPYIRMTKLALQLNNQEHANEYSRKVLNLNKQEGLEKYTYLTLLGRGRYLKSVGKSLHTDYFIQAIKVNETTDTDAALELIHSWLRIYNNPIPVMSTINDILTNETTDPATKASMYYRLGMYHERNKFSKQALNYYEQALKYLSTDTNTDKYYNTTEMTQDLLQRYYKLAQRLGGHQQNNTSITQGYRSGFTWEQTIS